MKTYFGSWDSLDDMRSSFADYNQPSPVPEDIEVLLASYGGGAYEGDAVVVFRKDGKLYEAHGSHCSCYGLEGQWSPEEATLESLQKTIPERLKYDHDSDAIVAFGQLVERLSHS